MGMAQKICCVGGCFSCIGTWRGANSPRPAHFICLESIVLHNFCERKRFFTRSGFSRAVFCFYQNNCNAQVSANRAEQEIQPRLFK